MPIHITASINAEKKVYCGFPERGNNEILHRKRLVPRYDTIATDCGHMLLMTF